MKANVPSRKKIKLNWFKAKADFSIDRKVDIEYTASTASYNKLNWEVTVRYIIIKEGDPKDIPVNSPMTLYKGGLPFLFLSTAGTIGKKIISEDLIDDDIEIQDDIVEIKEGTPEITFEDALKPKEHIEVRTRYDKILRRISIENKLDNQISMILNFKQTKDITYIKSEPQPTEIEEPIYKFDITIPSEQTSRITLELQAKIVKRVTKLKPEYVKKTKNQ